VQAGRKLSGVSRAARDFYLPQGGTNGLEARTRGGNELVGRLPFMIQEYPAGRGGERLTGSTPGSSPEKKVGRRTGAMGRGLFLRDFYHSMPDQVPRQTDLLWEGFGPARRSESSMGLGIHLRNVVARRMPTPPPTPGELTEEAYPAKQSAALLCVETCEDTRSRLSSGDCQVRGLTESLRAARLGRFGQRPFAPALPCLCVGQINSSGVGEDDCRDYGKWFI